MAQQNYPFSPSPVASGASCVALAVTAVSQTLTLAASNAQGGSVKIYAKGSQDVAFIYGNGTVVFPVAGGANGGDVIQAGTTQVFDLPGGVTQLAFIASAVGTTVFVTVGIGQ